MISDMLSFRVEYEILGGRRGDSNDSTALFSASSRGSTQWRRSGA